MTFEEIEEALRTATDSVELMHQQIAAFFSALPDPFFVLDPDGNYLEVLGGNAKELYNDGKFLKGKNIREVFTDRLRDLFASTIAEVISSGRLNVVEYALGPEDVVAGHGFSEAWFEGRVAAIHDQNGNATAVVWLAINVTAKKEAEAKLQALADRDHLTGAFNRRFFEQAAMRDFSLFRRFKTPFSLAFLDIDHFKSVNDNFGHDAGDEVLKHLVNLVSSQLRASDLLARFGGEEFVLLLPNTSSVDALRFAERLRESIATSAVSLARDRITCTVSIGISQVEDADTDHRDAIKRADNALYSSKQTGRNKTSVFQAT